MLEVVAVVVEVEVGVVVKALLWDRQVTARITTGSARTGPDRTSAKTGGEVKSRQTTLTDRNSQKLKD